MQNIKVIPSIKLLGIAKGDKLNFNIHRTNICKYTAS